MIKAVILIAVFAAAYYLLYISGYLTINMKSALTFISSKGSNRYSARFTSCDGYLKRVLRFPSDRTYTFTLNSELKNGSVSAKLLDSAKETVISLSGSASANVNVNAGKRYYLVISFDNTSGKYELTWNVNRDNNVL